MGCGFLLFVLVTGMRGGLQVKGVEAPVAEVVLHKWVSRVESVRHYSDKSDKFIETDYELKGIGWVDAFQLLSKKLVPAGWVVDVPASSAEGTGISVLSGPGRRRVSLESIVSGGLELEEIRLVEGSTSATAPPKPEDLLHEMIDQTYQKAVSPDRRYVAKLMYNESGAMTFGYYHVDLAPYGGEREEVVEVAAEGLSRMRWVGSRRLEVHYDAAEIGPDPWVKRLRTWHGVRIDYVKDPKVGKAKG